ncbi:TBC1 domain family member 15 [Histomonas meleagridis]|uniref:TBC1 domain family member 15 n=1 Tax=Histomonas meleagridis TaxID=135588 RepID=UPI00355ABC42|nr:TBC1 domain family member 15 [Histomonas meleagridis]KAH0796345.1 TBC1 domain family member 15 [Histomonas meleagridis]
MAFLDSTINVSLAPDGTEETPGVLKLQFTNGNVSVSFYPEQLISVGNEEKRKIAQIPDFVYHLSDFCLIEVDSNNDLLISLRGSNADCRFHFNNSHDVSTFFDSICQKARLEHSRFNPNVLLIDSLETSQIISYMVPILPRVPPRQSVILLSDLQSQNLIFTSQSEISQFTKDDFSLLFDSDGRITNSEFPSMLYNRDIDCTLLPQLWKFLLFDGYASMTTAERIQYDADKRSLYKTVKKQWQTTTKNQWRHNPDLRSIVRLLERDLHSYSSLFESFPNPQIVQRISFNILLTLSFYNWDNASYVEGLITLLSTFIITYIKEANEEHVVTLNDEILSLENVEADIFTVFNLFYEKNNFSNLIRPSKQPLLKQMFKEVGDILKQDFIVLLQLFNQKHVYSIEFMREDCEKLFSTCFVDKNDLTRLWVSVLASGDSREFMKCFIVAMMYSLAPKLLEMHPLNNEEFTRRYMKVKKEMDLGVLLHNTKELMKKKK